MVNGPEKPQDGADVTDGRKPPKKPQHSKKETPEELAARLAHEKADDDAQKNIRNGLKDSSKPPKTLPPAPPVKPASTLPPAPLYSEASKTWYGGMPEGGALAAAPLAYLPYGAYVTQAGVNAAAAGGSAYSIFGSQLLGNALMLGTPLATGALGYNIGKKYGRPYLGATAGTLTGIAATSLLGSLPLAPVVSSAAVAGAAGAGLYGAGRVHRSLWGMPNDAWTSGTILRGAVSPVTVPVGLLKSAHNWMWSREATNDYRDVGRALAAPVSIPAKVLSKAHNWVWGREATNDVEDFKRGVVAPLTVPLGIAKNVVTYPFRKFFGGMAGTENTGVLANIGSVTGQAISAPFRWTGKFLKYAFGKQAPTAPK